MGKEFCDWVSDSWDAERHLSLRPRKMAATRSFRWITYALLILGVVGGGTNLNAQEPPANESHVYDSDSQHLWNRLHRILFGRVDANGELQGLDEIDILFWVQTRHLLESPSHEAALTVLDEFLERGGETLVDDPLKKAMMQRDLWALFDWLAQEGTLKNAEGARQLQRRIVAVMRRIALSRESIESLPDNYAQAVESGHYPNTNILTKDGSPYLPTGLFDEAGPWIRIYGAGGYGGAEEHVMHTHGRSLFWVLIRLPDGREATEDYIRQLRDFGTPYETVDLINPPMAGRARVARQPGDFRLTEMIREGRKVDRGLTLGNTNVYESKNLPQFPAGTEVALVRQTLLIDDQGDVVPTNLTEEIQLRAFRHTEPFRPSLGFGFSARRQKHAEVPFVLRLRREALFQGQHGGLVALDGESREYPTFRTHGFDPFTGPVATAATFTKDPDSRRVTLERCDSCHQGAGVYSFLSRQRIIGVPGRYMPQQGLGRTEPEKPVERSEDTADAIRWKQRQYDWGLFEGIWETSAQ